MSIHNTLSSLYSGPLIRVSPTLLLPEGFRKLFLKLQYVSTQCFELLVEISLKYLLKQEVDEEPSFNEYLEMWTTIQKIEPEPLLYLFLSEYISSGFTCTYINLIKYNYFSFQTHQLDIAKRVINNDKLLQFLVYNPQYLKHCQIDILENILPKIINNMKLNYWEARLKNVDTEWHQGIDLPKSPYKKLESVTQNYLIRLLEKGQILRVKHSGVWYFLKYTGKIEYQPVCASLTHLSLKMALSINTVFSCFDSVVLTENKAYIFYGH